ncbi:uncharacterized protein LOC142237475 [Haematobia irritans]|uniref:uncharacterized protein LOC142237475 n=1 Tax=Haematobia irritans TaxID=7368 RepID=UPI003F50B8ED
MTSTMFRSHCWPLIILVVSVLWHGTHGQSYHFIIGHHQRNFDQLYRDPPPNNNNNNHQYPIETNQTDSSSVLEDSNNNSSDSTLILVQNSIRDSSNELSQTAMDIITIVWYVATFLALAAFFLLMACSDRRCADASQRTRTTTTSETPIPPPTPSPSYSEFAPPSYDSVMKLQHANKPSIFVIPFPNDQTPKDNQSPNTPTLNVYTINELQKLGS